MGFRLLIDMEVVEFTDRLPSRIRVPIRRAFSAIKADPEGQSDAKDFDESGRLLNIKIVGDFATDLLDRPRGPARQNSGDTRC